MKARTIFLFWAVLHDSPSSELCIFEPKVFPILATLDSLLPRPFCLLEPVTMTKEAVEINKSTYRTELKNKLFLRAEQDLKSMKKISAAKEMYYKLLSQK